VPHKFSRSGLVHLQPLARAQLTLVEHALCPLDAGVSLQPGCQFKTWYAYSDRNRNRRKSQVRIGTLDGLSAHDELYLWGLLSLALSQPEPQLELLATPYYCLRQMGIIDADKGGGREFELFREALKRLAGIRYQNDAFYDPVRGEHRAVAFGFLNYSLPLESTSSRAWRFAWDPIFFEFAQAAGGALSFDVTLFRQLDPASRRLYLYLKKLFWKREQTGTLELRHLAVNVLGFAPALETCDLRKKLTRCIEQLLTRELLQLPSEVATVRELFQKQRKGVYTLTLHRGPAFSTKSFSPGAMESPLSDVLKSIGFDDGMIGHILRKYPAKTIEQWADITLAARERHGPGFFKNSPQAYFIDNVKAAVGSGRTPPDWWRELRKQELQRERDQERSKARLLDAPAAAADFEEYLRTEAKEAFTRIMDRLVADLQQGGQPEPQARENAAYHARLHFWNRYQKEHPQAGNGEGFQPLRSLV